MSVTSTAAGDRGRVPEPSQRSEPSLDAVVDTFAQITAALSAEVDLDALLHLIAQQVCAVLGVSRCALYLRDSDHGLFRGRAIHPGSRPAAAEWMRRSVAGIEADRFTQEILSTKEPVLIVNTFDDPRPMRRAMMEWDIRTMLGVPMILRDEVIGLLFLDNAAVPHEFTPATQRLAGTLANLSAVAISQSRHNAEMRKTLKTVVSQNRLLRQVSAMDTQLSQQLLAGASLQEIADSIVTMTGHPCGIYDADFSTRALGRLSGEETAVPRLMSPEIRVRPEVAGALRALTPAEAKVIEPLPQSGVHHRHLVTRVPGEGDGGYVVMIDHRQRLTAFDAMVLRRAATMVALELNAERRAFDVDRHARESLVRDLVHSLDEPRSLQRRAAFHRLALSDPHLICLITRRDGPGVSPDTRPPALSDVRDVCTRLNASDRLFCAADETGVVLLLALDPEEPQSARSAAAKSLARRIVSELDPGGQVIAALSPVCREAADYPRALVEARQIIGCMTTLLAEPGVWVLGSDDLGAGRLLLGSATPEAAERFARDSAGALLDGGGDRRQLLSTLITFCEANRNVRATGALLGIHENTVRYRLNKVTEITGLDVVSSADDHLTMQLALLVFKLRGWLTDVR